MDSLELSTLKLEILNLAQDLVLSTYKDDKQISEEEITIEILDVANKYLDFVDQDDFKFNILIIAHTRGIETDLKFLDEKIQTVLDIANSYLTFTVTE